MGQGEAVFCLGVDFEPVCFATSMLVSTTLRIGGKCGLTPVPDILRPD